jgi:hypothetical protein
VPTLEFVPGYNVVLFKTNPQNPKTYVNNTIFKLIINFEKIQITLTQKLAGQSQQLAPITAIPRIRGGKIFFFLGTWVEG